jgi:hypothetical protein
VISCYASERAVVAKIDFWKVDEALKHENNTYISGG